MTLQTEYYMRSLKEAWREQRSTEGLDMPLNVWASHQLLNQDFADAGDFGVLETQVRALGELAEMSYDSVTRHLNRIWFSTPAGSAALRSQGSSGRIRSSMFSSPGKTPPRDQQEQPRAAAQPPSPSRPEEYTLRTPTPATPPRQGAQREVKSPEDRARKETRKWSRPLEKLAGPKKSSCRSAAPRPG